MLDNNIRLGFSRGALEDIGGCARRLASRLQTHLEGVPEPTDEAALMFITEMASFMNQLRQLDALISKATADA